MTARIVAIVAAVLAAVPTVTGLAHLVAGDSLAAVEVLAVLGVGAGVLCGVAERKGLL
jgi:hypothetical protein